MSQLDSIDDLQDKFDKLVLTFLVSVQNEVSQTKAASFHKILESYNAMLASIENLNGIDHTPAQQMDKMKKLSELYQEARVRVLDLEKELIERGNEVDEELDQSF